MPLHWKKCNSSFIAKVLSLSPISVVIFINILDSDNCIFIFKKQKAKEKQIKLFKSFKSEATPTKQACMMTQYFRSICW